jgi:Uma2 family endonuclease
VEDAGLGIVRQSINLAANADDWKRNFRIPDVVVFLNGSEAVCHDTFWTGPPDFLIEIVSPYDKTREKLSFYGKLGTRELLLIDRDPWQLELYRQQNGHLTRCATSSVDEPAPITTTVLPLSFQLRPAEPRPTLEVIATNSKKKWTM